jgi:hypothetical protein
MATSQPLKYKRKQILTASRGATERIKEVEIRYFKGLAEQSRVTGSFNFRPTTNISDRFTPQPWTAARPQYYRSTATRKQGQL